jgi:hypothetical protein
MPNDIPVPGDYDGVGHTELAVFRPSTGQWLVLGPSGARALGTFGLPTDIPAPGDYDGVGHTELAVFRPSTGQWFVLGPNGARALGTLGVPTDIPAPGDYDGVGNTELAVFRSSSAQWFIARQPSGSVTFFDNGKPLNTGTLKIGRASFSTKLLTVGVHVITAQYGGNNIFSPSSSNPVSVTVLPPITVPTTVQTAYENVKQAISGISIDNGVPGSPTLALVVSHGTLSVGTTSGLMVTGNGTGLLTLVGASANLNVALASLVYLGSKGYSGSDALSVTLTQNGISFNASVAITVVSIAQQDTALQAQVMALPAGTLTLKQANKLLAELSLQGKSGDIGKIGSFINDVNGYLNSPVLTQEQAEALDALLGPANILLLGLKVEFGP